MTARMNAHTEIRRLDANHEYLRLAMVQTLLAEDLRETFGVSQSTAEKFTEIFLAMCLTHPTEDASMAAALEQCMASAAKNEPWALEMNGAHVRRNLAAWTRVHDEAKRAGQDPAAVLSTTFGMRMESAQGIVRMIETHEGGEPRDPADVSPDQS